VFEASHKTLSYYTLPFYRSEEAEGRAGDPAMAERLAGVTAARATSSAANLMGPTEQSTNASAPAKSSPSRITCSHHPVRQSGSGRKENNLTCSKDFNLKVEAMIWP